MALKCTWSMSLQVGYNITVCLEQSPHQYWSLMPIAHLAQLDIAWGTLLPLALSLACVSGTCMLNMDDYHLSPIIKTRSPALEVAVTLLVQCMCTCMHVTHLLPLLGWPHTNCCPSVVHCPHCLTHERLTSYLHSYHVTCSLQHTTCWCEHTA